MFRENHLQKERLKQFMETAGQVKFFFFFGLFYINLYAIIGKMCDIFISFQCTLSIIDTEILEVENEGERVILGQSFSFSRANFSIF